jgi:hypothetical protein
LKEIKDVAFYVVEQEAQTVIILKEVNGGMGIPENTVTHCPDCHYQFDFGKNSEWYKQKTKEYLQNYYGETWNEKDLVYKKY